MAKLPRFWRPSKIRAYYAGRRDVHTKTVDTTRRGAYGQGVIDEMYAAIRGGRR